MQRGDGLSTVKRGTRQRMRQAHIPCGLLKSGEATIKGTLRAASARSNNGFSPTKSGTDAYWDSEINAHLLFVGARSRTWCFHKDIGDQTKLRFETLRAGLRQLFERLSTTDWSVRWMK